MLSCPAVREHGSLPYGSALMNGDSRDFGAVVWAGYRLGLSAWKTAVVLTWVVILAMDTWHWTSLVIILAYSALTTIPDRLYAGRGHRRRARPAGVRHIFQLPRLQPRYCSWTVLFCGLWTVS